MQDISIESLGLGFVEKCIDLYWGDMPFLWIAMLVLVFLFFKKKKEDKFIIIYTVFLALTAYNPIIVKTFWKVLNEDTTYYRLFWLLPVSLILAYGTVKLIGFAKENVVKGIIIVAVVGLTIMFGTPLMNTKQLLKVPTNIWMVEDDILVVSELVHQGEPDKEVRVAASPDVVKTIRQYDPTVILTIDSNSILAWQGTPDRQYLIDEPWYKNKEIIMNTMYNGDTSNTEEFLAAISYTGTEYLVGNFAPEVNQYFKDLGFQRLGNSSMYVVYRCSGEN